MGKYFTNRIADALCSDFQWLIGRKYITPFAEKKIEAVEIESMEDGSYKVMVKIFLVNKEAPNIHGLIDPKCELLKYLNLKGIPIDKEKYGLHKKS